MDTSTIIIIGLILVIVALLDDMHRSRAHSVIKTISTVPIVSDGFVYPWWRNYYFGPRGYYMSPFRIY